jgi:plasmid stabilization system protein ParE
MKYKVVILPEAQANIAQAYNYIAARSPMNAVKWWRGLNGQIDGLELFPRRFGRAREQAHFEEEIRQVIYKNYRVIFTIDESQRVVRVVFVRHAKRRAVGEESAE